MTAGPERDAYRCAGEALGYGLGSLFAVIDPAPVTFVGIGATAFDLIEPALREAIAQTAGNAGAAGNKVAMCIGCHGIPGYKSGYPEVYKVPMLGGQSAKYLENALQAYKKGERNNPGMRGIAAGLSDQDIADIAAYYAQQK